MQNITALFQPIFVIIGTLSLAAASAVFVLFRRDKQRSFELSAAKKIIDDITREQWILLSEANKALGASLDYDQTLLSVSQLAVPGFADYCVVDLVDDDQKRYRVQSGSKAPNTLLAIDGANDPISKAILSGKPQIFTEISDPLLSALAGSPDRLTFVRGLKLKSAIIVPMATQHSILGAMTFALTHLGRRYSDFDVDLALQLTTRCALAVENARFYQKEKQAVQARDQLLAVVSHELKTPLTAINLRASLLLRELDDPKVAAQIEAIRQSTKNVHRIIDDLLNVDKLERRQFKLERSIEQIDAVLAEVVEMMQPIAQTNRVALDMRASGSSFSVNIDKVRLCQAISNIIGNAIKFTPEEGTVSVSSRIIDHQSVEISVSDSGGGMSPESVAHAFDRYWQDTRTSHLGSGLGLYVAKSIIELHGGGIKIVSSLGRGTTVLITIPLA